MRLKDTRGSHAQAAANLCGRLVISGIVSVTLWRELQAEKQAHAAAPLAQPKSQEPVAAAPATPTQSDMTLSYRPQAYSLQPSRPKWRQQQGGGDKRTHEH